MQSAPTLLSEFAVSTEETSDVTAAILVLKTKETAAIYWCTKPFLRKSKKKLCVRVKRIVVCVSALSRWQYCAMKSVH